MESDIETERKFLVADPSVIPDGEGCGLIQGYLHGRPDHSIRVRIDNADLGVITVKGPRTGASRPEREWAVERALAEELLSATNESPIVKTRYPLMAGRRLWTIDVFGAENSGLILAEVEFDRNDPLDPSTEIPAWCGQEVTDDERYYNANLALSPYSTWHC